MQVRRSALLVALGAATLAGCGDTTAFRAQFPARLRLLTAFAINGTSASLPSALAVRASSVVTVDPTWAFDLAFDMDSTGRVTVHSVRAVASELTPVNRVGFRIDSVNAFADITNAPTSGYAYDTSFALSGGRTLLVDVLDPSCQGRSFLGFNIRAKLALDSVNVSTRAIYFRMLANPNCGFHALVEGLPKE